MTCKSKKCGCLDTGLTTPSPCPHDNYVCPERPACPETFSDECLIHTGDSIVELGINQGDNMSTILQRLALWFTNPQCIDPDSVCRSVLNLNSTVITPTTIKVDWIITNTPTYCQVEYKLASSLSWTLNPSVLYPISTDTIGGLTPDSWYNVRVNSVCTVGQCYSVTILLKTKP